MHVPVLSVGKAVPLYNNSWMVLHAGVHLCTTVRLETEALILIFVAPQAANLCFCVFGIPRHICDYM